MNTDMAFVMGELNRDKELMIFDWDKAARIIKERKLEVARAGLRGDWEYTGGTIYQDGKPCKNGGTYLASTWAVPELAINEDVIPCYRMQHEVPEWGAKTCWPKSALDILDGKD